MYKSNRAEKPSARIAVRRRPDRASYSAEAAGAILDEALVCHVGFCVDNQPFVIPTIHARLGDTLYLHGSPASRMLRNLAIGVEVCVTVTLVDALVLARSWMHHSVNYRSAVIFGRAVAVEDAEVKLAELRVLVDHVVPGRGASSRSPSPKELAATLVLAVPLGEASVKTRSGPPVDDEADYQLDVWAGIVPLALRPGPPLADPVCRPGLRIPDHISGWRQPGRPIT